MKKIKLLYVITALNVGGAEMNLYRLIASIDHARFELLVVSLMNQGVIGKMIEEDLEVPVVPLGFNGWLKSIIGFIEFIRLIKSWKPQIVHSHMVHANFAARWARLLRHFPVLICTIHNIEERGKQRSARWRLLIYRFSDFLCDLTTQVSLAGLNKYVKIKAVPAKKIFHIPNGIEVDSFKRKSTVVNSLRQQLNPDKRFTFLAVGSLTEQKDYSNLLHAYALYLEKYPDSLMLIAGDGPLKDDLLALSGELGLSETVIFLGLRRDVPDLMAFADAFVIASAWEGLPLVLLEAAASSLPIIATNVGGNSEIVLEGENGLLVKPGDHCLLSQAMLTLRNRSASDRKEMGMRGYKLIEEGYAQSKIVFKWEKLYQLLLTQKSDATTLKTLLG